MEAEIKEMSEIFENCTKRRWFFYFLPGRKDLHLIALLHKGKIICPLPISLQWYISSTSHSFSKIHVCIRRKGELLVHVLIYTYE